MHYSLIVKCSCLIRLFGRTKHTTTSAYTLWRTEQAVFVIDRGLCRARTITPKLSADLRAQRFFEILLLFFGRSDQVFSPPYLAFTELWRDRTETDPGPEAAVVKPDSETIDWPPKEYRSGAGVVFREGAREAVREAVLEGVLEGALESVLEGGLEDP